MHHLSQAINHPKAFHHQRRLWLLGGMGLFLDGLDLFIIALALPLITAQMPASSWQLGWIAGAAPLGSVVGACIFGHMADRFGRRLLLLINMLTFIGCALLSALAWNISSLILFRFLLGLGIGMDFPISAAYMIENLPKRWRYKGMACAMLLNCLGSLVAILISYGLLFYLPSLHTWRLILASTALPAAIALIYRLNLPESPRWLAATGQASAVNESVRELTGHHFVLQNPTPRRPHLRELFTNNLWRMTLVVSLIWLLHDITYYGLGMFTPMFLKALHQTNAAGHGLLTSVMQVAKSTAIVDLFIVLGAALSVIFIDKLSLLKLQIIGFLGTVIGLLFLLFAYTNNALTPAIWLLSGFILFNIFANLGPGITTYIIPAELYPSHTRATGHGFAAATGKLGAVLGVVLLPLTQKTLGNAMLLAILIILSLLAVVLTYYLQEPDLEAVDLNAYEI